MFNKCELLWQKLLMMMMMVLMVMMKKIQLMVMIMMVIFESLTLTHPPASFLHLLPLVPPPLPAVFHFCSSFVWCFKMLLLTQSAWLNYSQLLGFPGGSGGEESTCNAGDLGSIPGLGRSAGGGHGNPLQYSCLENPHGQRSLAGCSPWGRKKSDTTEWLSMLGFTVEFWSLWSRVSQSWHCWYFGPDNSFWWGLSCALKDV